MRDLHTTETTGHERFPSGHGIGNPGSLCVTRDITQLNYREHMRRSLGLKICWKMEIKIDETYHVEIFCCPQYVHVVFGKNSLHRLSFIVKRQGRRLKANSASDRPPKNTIFFRENRIQSLNKHARLVEHEFL